MKRVWLGLCAGGVVALVAAVVVLSVLLHRATTGGPPVNDALARKLLRAVRRPAPDQFKTPEEVIRFAVARLIDQDMAEASRAFPIVEVFTRWDFETRARDTLMMMHDSPWPGREYHNATVALGRLSQLEETTNRLLTGEGFVLRRITEGSRDDDIAALAQTFDVSRLTDLRILSIKPLSNQIPFLTPELKSLGCTEVHDDEATVQFEGSQARLRFTTAKIEGQWRVLSMSAGPAEVTGA